MKEITIEVTETNYGTVTVKVPDDADIDAVKDIATKAWDVGDTTWNETEMTFGRITSIDGKPVSEEVKA